MGSQRAELTALVGRVRNRWRAVTILRLWTRAAGAAAVVLACAAIAHRVLQPAPTGLVALWVAAAVVVIGAFVWCLASLRRAPSDLTVARFVEECCPELEDSLVTAVGGSEVAPESMSAAVLDDALRRARLLDIERIVSRQTLRRAALLAAAAALAFAAAGAVSVGPAREAATVLLAYVFPQSLELQVAPGNARVREGESLRVVARLTGSDAIVPMLRIGADGDRRDVPMLRTADGFSYEVEEVDHDFQYSVTAAGTASPEFSVTVLRLPRVERIDLRYEFPPAFGMPARQEEDGGDIYGPAGTRVHVTVHTDKPVRDAALKITGGDPVALSANDRVVQGELTITEDGSYRIALSDGDGLTNPGDTEYFIRTLLDQPPDVRIVRPASDRQVTRLEEVAVEARADDDFGVAALDLVYKTAGGAEKVVPFTRSGSATAVTGRTMLYLEDLDVRPGDVVAYYARARDVSRGKRSSEARSDIFFLEVTPFEEEFVAAQSQGAGGGGGNDQGLEDLIDAQKDIITATWNLDRRGRQAGSRSSDDIRTVARGQRDLQSRTATMLEEMRRAGERRRRLPGGRGGAAAPASPDAMTEAIRRAADAMTGAHGQLEALKTAEALPHEMTALNELLRAQAEVRRREIQQQQANGNGGGGSNRRQQDISSLFDRELARQQQTNYETPPASETRRDEPAKDDAAERMRELARRQDALTRRQQDLARKRDALPPEEIKRELERLTREQTELRQRAEELSRELQQRSQAQGGRGGGSGGAQSDRQQAARELQQASEDMQAAATELRRDNPQQASARGGRAADRLRDAEQQMRGAQPDDRRRALGDLQLESRQLAEEQRRLSGAEAGRAGDPADRARQRAAEQDRLADRTERLEQSVKQLAGGRGADPRQQSAMSGAASEVARQRLSERMREAARAERQSGQPGTGNQPSTRREGEAIAQGLERLADRLGAAGGETPESQQLSDQLARVRRLREQLATLDRELSQLRDQQGPRGQSAGRQGNDPGREGRAGREGGGQTGRAGMQQDPQSGRGSQPGGRGQDVGEGPWQEARELLQELRDLESVVPAEADGFNPGRSAPGTEAWKQDFSKWDELKVQLAAALEKTERTAADRLRGEQSRDRLNAGASQAVPEEYRRMVEKYYRALASGSDKR